MWCRSIRWWGGCGPHLRSCGAQILGSRNSPKLSCTHILIYVCLIEDKLRINIHVLWQKLQLQTYAEEYEQMQSMSKEEYLASLRRRSSGFSRGVSKYRGVARFSLSPYTLELVLRKNHAIIVDSITRSNPNHPQFDRHHHNGRWEARIGRVLGNKYLYLGTFSMPLAFFIQFCLRLSLVTCLIRDIMRHWCNLQVSRDSTWCWCTWDPRVFCLFKCSPRGQWVELQRWGPATHLFVLCWPEASRASSFLYTVSRCASDPPCMQATWARFLEHHTFLIRSFPLSSLSIHGFGLHHSLIMSWWYQCSCRYAGGGSPSLRSRCYRVQRPQRSDQLRHQLLHEMPTEASPPEARATAAAGGTEIRGAHRSNTRRREHDGDPLDPLHGSRLQHVSGPPRRPPPDGLPARLSGRWRLRGQHRVPVRRVRGKWRHGRWRRRWGSWCRECGHLDCNASWRGWRNGFLSDELSLLRFPN